MRLRLLDKYVLKELLWPFLFGVASFSSIFIASSMLFKMVKYITTYGAPASAVVKMFLFSMPEVINYTFPMSMLLATLMAFGKMSGSSEIVAMKSGGVSYYRILAPVMVVGLLVSMFSVVWAEKVVPPSKAAARAVIEQEIKGNIRPESQNHIVVKTINNKEQRITYARSFNQDSGIMKGVTIEEFDNNVLKRIQTAEYAIWKDNSWVIKNGNVFTLDEKDGVSSKVHFDEQVLPLKVTPKAISWEQKDPEEMTLGELKAYVGLLEKQHQPTGYYRTEAYMRFAIPLASFVFALLGAPLGTQRQRGGSSIGMGISVIVIFVYYGIMAFTTGLGKGGAMPPILAAMLPNILCLVSGIWLVRKSNF